MAGTRGLGGRHALAAARWRSISLVALLCLPLALAALQRLADTVTAGYIQDYGLFRTGYAGALFAIYRFASCAAPFMAGVLVDRYGVRRVVGLTMLGWCAIVALGAVVSTPEVFLLGAQLSDSLVLGFVLCAALVALVRALPARRRGVTAAVVLTAYLWTRERPRFLATLLRHAVTGWPEALFLLVTGGALLVGVWLVAYRESPPHAVTEAEARPFPLRDLGTAVALIIWLEVVFVMFPETRPSLESLWRGEAHAAEVAAWLATPLAFIAAAYGTDRFARHLGAPPASRRFVLVPAFLAASLVGLTLALPDSPRNLTLLIGITAGLLRTTELLAIDRAPPRAAGLFIGLVLTGRLVTIYYLGPLLRTTLPTGAVLGVAGLAGAVAAALLLRPRTTR